MNEDNEFQKTEKRKITPLLMRVRNILYVTYQLDIQRQEDGIRNSLSFGIDQGKTLKDPKFIATTIWPHVDEGKKLTSYAGVSTFDLVQSSLHQLKNKDWYDWKKENVPVDISVNDMPAEVKTEPQESHVSGATPVESESHRPAVVQEEFKTDHTYRNRTLAAAGIFLVLFLLALVYVWTNPEQAHPVEMTDVKEAVQPEPPKAYATKNDLILLQSAQTKEHEALVEKMTNERQADVAAIDQKFSQISKEVGNLKEVVAKKAPLRTASAPRSAVRTAGGPRINPPPGTIPVLDISKKGVPPRIIYVPVKPK